MYTPPMKLLNIEKIISANSPGIASTVVKPIFQSAVREWSGSVFGASSGKEIVNRWISEARTNKIASNSVHPIPSNPMDKPLNTLVAINAMPCTAPTRPLAFACRSGGISSVTVVDKAIPRICSTTAPMRMTEQKSQNCQPPILSIDWVGNQR